MNSATSSEVLVELLQSFRNDCQAYLRATTTDQPADVCKKIGKPVESDCEVSLNLVSDRLVQFKDEYTVAVHSFGYGDIAPWFINYVIVSGIRWGILVPGEPRMGPYNKPERRMLALEYVRETQCPDFVSGSLDIALDLACALNMARAVRKAKKDVRENTTPGV